MTDKNICLAIVRLTELQAAEKRGNARPKERKFLLTSRRSEMNNVRALLLPFLPCPSHQADAK